MLNFRNQKYNVELLLAIGITIFGIACNPKTTVNENRKTEINSSIFYYVKKPDTPKDTLISHVEGAVNTIFNLASIYDSKQDAELRIYFENAFFTRFLHLKVKGSEFHLELIEGKPEKKGDSLFMRLGRDLKLVDPLFLDSINFIRNLSDMDWAQFKGIHDHFNHEDMLDAGEAFHIQVSNFGKTHIFFYYDPFDYKKTRPDADKFWRLIKHLEKTFKFEFSDRMPKSLGSK